MNNALLFFIKYPTPGTVKTRLGNDIGPENAARLYRSFVEDMLAEFDRARLDVIIFHSPERQIEKFEQWLGKRSFSPQQGNGLGERMKNAFSTAFSEGCSCAILTGSDLPGLDSKIIHDGFKQLENAPACIGPARDGGYYLIGFQRENFCTEIFSDMHWSTPEVFGTTIDRLRSNHCPPEVLPSFSDVDTLDDLKKLLDNTPVAKKCPRTIETARLILHPPRK